MGDLVRSFDASALRTFPATVKALKERGLLTPTVTLDELRSGLDEAERAVVDQVIALRPADYGVSTPYEGELEPVPGDLVMVTGQQYTSHGRRETLGDKYVPRPVFAAYQRLDAAFGDARPGRRLLIQSCYRSPAYQVTVFLMWLIKGYQGDIGRTIRHASPPSYSQHTIASKAAIDFATIDGSPSEDHPEDFAQTVEYQWLRGHGGEFGFHESWPEGNELGMRAEPWHWQFRP